jgi:hypothetical protein
MHARTHWHTSVYLYIYMRAYNRICDLLSKHVEQVQTISRTCDSQKKHFPVYWCWLQWGFIDMFSPYSWSSLLWWRDEPLNSLLGSLSNTSHVAIKTNTCVAISRPEYVFKCTHTHIITYNTLASLHTTMSDMYLCIFLHPHGKEMHGQPRANRFPHLPLVLGSPSLHWIRSPGRADFVQWKRMTPLPWPKQTPWKIMGHHAFWALLIHSNS